MATAKKQSKVSQAYDFAAPVRKVLHEIGKCMEVTEDKRGIVWERWIVGRQSVVVFASPMYCEVFTPATNDMTWAAVIDELRAFASKQR